MTGGPRKERGTNKPPPTGRVWKRSKWDTTCPTTSQNPSRWHPSWLNKACTTRKDSESQWLTKDNPETNPITIKPRDCEPCDRAVLLGSLTLLLSTRVPFPNKISCLSAHVSPQDNSFLTVRQEPSFRPWKGSSFLQHFYFTSEYRASLVTQCRICLPCGRSGFDPWVGKVPWRNPLQWVPLQWQPTPVFLPGESHGQRSPVG